ncbi:MAG: hypothetical protein ACI4TW_06865 [Prevotella sp.]
MNSDSPLRQRLSQHIGKSDIDDICRLAAGGDDLTESLLTFITDADDRTRVNALWVLTHFPASADNRFLSRRHRLYDLLLAETNPSARRLLLSLLCRLPFTADDIDTRLLDFCLSLIGDSSQSVGIRSLAMKLSFMQCRHYPELRSELRQVIELSMPDVQASAAMKSVWKHISKSL